MRYLFGFLCVCALVLSVTSLTGCGDPCQGVICDDGNECTEDECDADGWCVHEHIPGCVKPACVDRVCECTEGGIEAAGEEGGGPFTFDCDGATTVVTKRVVEFHKDVVLDGGGSLIIDGAYKHRVVVVLPAVTAKLVGITMQHGQTTNDPGGGLVNAGQLTLVDVTVSENEALQSCVCCGSISFCSCHCEGGSGGGVYNGGTLWMSDSTVSDNGAESSGGGIVNGGTLWMSDSTVSDNWADSSGGGIENAGTLWMSDSTVSDNGAGHSGDGIENNGSLILTHTTLSGNEGGAIAGGGVTIANSVIDGACTGDGNELTSLGYNVESPGNTCGFSQGTDKTGVSADNLKLGPLQDNGGPTQTHALLPGSVAIDVIPEVDCVDADGAQLTMDQRGFTRPVGDGCDVGALEVQP